MNYAQANIAKKAESTIKYKIIVVMIGFFVAFLCLDKDAQAQEKTIGNFTYTYQDYQYPSAKKIWVTRIKIRKKAKVNTLKIPSKIDGKKVVKLGAEDKYERGENIFGMYSSEDDNTMQPKGEGVISSVAKIKEIILPDSVTSMNSDCFSYLQDGKAINIPKGITKNVKWLCYIKWKKFSVSSQNPRYKVKNGILLSKNGKKISGFVGPGNKAVIPNGVKRIGQFTILGNADEVFIPKSVTKIERWSLSRVSRFHVATGNKNYGASNNCVYSKRSGRLVAAGDTSGVIKIPENVTCLKKGVVLGSGWIKKIVFPASLKRIEEGWNSRLDAPYKIKLVFKGRTPPKLVDTALHEGLHLPIVYVKKGTKEKYKKALKKSKGLLTIKEY